MEAFSKFGGDLDAATKAVLDKGARNVEILKQGQYNPMAVEKQVAIIYCGTTGLLKDIPTSMVRSFENEYLELLELRHRDILDKIRDGQITSEITSVLEKVASELVIKFIPQ
jgi:F-type H+-transporting ATPase subunit alpha